MASLELGCLGLGLGCSWVRWVNISFPFSSVVELLVAVNVISSVELQSDNSQKSCSFQFVDFVSELKSLNVQCVFC